MRLLSELLPRAAWDDRAAVGDEWQVWRWALAFNRQAGSSAYRNGVKTRTLSGPTGAAS